MLEGLEVVEVGQQDFLSKKAQRHTDVNLLSALKEAAFAHVGQEAEFDIFVARPPIAGFLLLSEDAAVVSWN
jgi:hypothetical protein